MNNTDFTAASAKLFRDIVTDLPNWTGVTPCFNHITSALRGNLTDLKKRGLVTTFRSDGDEWIELTAAGEKHAHALGLGKFLPS
jgi:hypothetical protein